MMKYKCPYCGLEFSDKVYPIHIQRCAKKPIEKPEEADDGAGNDDGTVQMDNPNMFKEMEYNDLRSAAKEAGLELGKNPSKPELIEALEINHFGEVQPEVGE